MTNFKKAIDNELSAIRLSVTEEDIIKSANRKPAFSPSLPRIAAAVLVLVLLCGICFMPNLFGKDKNSFTIYAGSEELNDKRFVVISDDEDNFIHFDFNKVLDENADLTDITRRYLFYSFEKRFNLRIEGENIYNVKYFINNGTLVGYEKSLPNKYGDYGVSLWSTYTKNEERLNGIYIGYDRQNNITFSLTPTEPLNDWVRFLYELEDMPPYIALPDSGKVITDDKFNNYFPDKIHVDAESLGYNPIAYGFKPETPSIATDEEIEKLKEYLSADDMTGFYNYQNQIFKRIIDKIQIDAIIYTNSARNQFEIVTIQLCYNPITVTEEDLKDRSTNHSESLSKGTVSAKLIDTPADRHKALTDHVNSFIE